MKYKHVTKPCSLRCARRVANECFVASQYQPIYPIIYTGLFLVDFCVTKSWFTAFNLYSQGKKNESRRG